jgi:hypothetical protein
LNIGDIWFGFRGDDKGLMVDAKKSGAAAGTTAGKSFEAKLGSSFRKGLGLGAGIGAFNLLSSAISGTIGALTDSVAKAKEEEVGIARLTASLESNIPGWDGSTDAIEKNIDAMVRTTGFSDGDMRDSLAKLVASTHNVDEAFRIQAAAMDLARFKGISLVDASTALIKVEGGQYRALKELGIVLKKGATATDALAAVQKVAGGQMAAYMDTAAGKSEVLTNRLEDMQEEIGQRLTPVFTGATEALLELMDAMEGKEGPKRFVDAQFQAKDAVEGLGDALSDSLDFLTPWDEFVGASAERQIAAQKRVDASIQVVGSSWADLSAKGREAMKEMVTASEGAKDDIVADNRKLRTSYKDVVDYLLGAYSDNFDRAMGIEEARADLSAGRHEAASLRKQIASGKLTRKEIADAEARIAELDVESADHYEKLAEMGALSQKDYDTWLAVVEKLARGTKGKVHDAYMAAIRDIRALKAAASGNIDVSVTYKKAAKPGQGAVPQAAGGPYMAGQPYWVGEKGPELRVESASGYTLNHDDAMAAVRGGGNTITIYNPEPRAAEADIGRVLRRTAALGMG